LASAMVPGPAMLGAAAGFMVWEGGSGLLGAARQGAGLGWTLAGAASGAAVSWMLWRMQLRSLRREAKHAKKADRSLGAVLAPRTLPDRPFPMFACVGATPTGEFCKDLNSTDLSLDEVRLGPDTRITYSHDVQHRPDLGR